MLLVDHEIRLLSRGDSPLLFPFSEAGSSGGPGYGVTSAGYDLRLDREIWHGNVHTQGMAARGVKSVSARDMKHTSLVSMAYTIKHYAMEDSFILMPGEFVLGRSIEYIRIPRDVAGRCVGKSTLARMGILINTTPLEPMWCLSEDTEVLAEGGWKLLSDVKIGEKVLTRRWEDGVATFEKVANTIMYHYTGDMLHFAGRSIDQLVTPNHKMFVKNNYHGNHEFALVCAEDIFGKWNYQMSRDVRWIAPSFPSKVAFGDVSYDSADFAEFYGCWLGDGSAYYGNDGGYHIKLAVVTKEEKRNHFRSLLTRLGIKAREHERGFHWYGKPLCTFLMQHGHAKDKYIDNMWKAAPAPILEKILVGLIASDGNKETLTYSTASPQLASDVQEIAYKAGLSAIVRKVTSNINGKEFEAFRVRLCYGQSTPKIDPLTHKRLAYDAPVYCLSVPNHVFFCRRNGKASWTGNCGTLTIEIANVSQMPVELFFEDGIAQLQFEKLSSVPEITYADKKGVYQGQVGVTPSRVR